MKSVEGRSNVNKFINWLASLVPSPRYVRSLEKRLEQSEHERRELLNSTLSHAGYSTLSDGKPSGPQPQGRVRVLPSQWRRRTEQQDREQGLPQENAS